MISKEDAELLQRTVAEFIDSVGGYWPPLGGLARVLEELGELAVAVGGSTSHSPSLASISEECADLFVITTCLANQYCCSLWDSYRDLQTIDSAPSEASVGLELTAHCGELARTINLYEGEKSLKPDEKITPIGQAVASIHRELISFGLAYGFSLQEVVLNSLIAKKRRDAGRFIRKYDPSDALSVRRFRVIQDNTQCPFARTARIWGAPDWDPTKVIAENATELASHLRRFAKIAPHEKLDGFVVEIPDPTQMVDINTFKKMFKDILVALSRFEGSTSNFNAAEVMSESWQFTFAGLRLFTITFAPFYPSTSSRFSFGVDSCFIFFQPEESFKNFRIPRGNTREGVRRAIRQAFRDAGRAYEGTIIREPFEAPRYIKPLRLGDKPVEWWSAEDVPQCRKDGDS